jgi:hypothetical protein
MDLVYICRPGENEELRYSIRSAVKNLPHDKIWVVGGKPPWYRGNYIEVPQRKSKYKNARANMDAIVASKEISDDFILMNDDFFIIDYVETPRYYHAGPLKNKINYFETTHPRSKYTQLLKKSMRILNEQGISNPKDYALHIPFVMNKQKLAEVLPLSMSWHLSYGNIYAVGGELVRNRRGEGKDVKVYARSGEEAKMPTSSISNIYLSSGDDSFGFLKGYLEDLFPQPSKYEKPERPRAVLPPSKNKATISIFSQKNASWSGVGKVYRGHNLVREDQARLWLTRGFIRISTPEEIYKEFGIVREA